MTTNDYLNADVGFQTELWRFFAQFVHDWFCLDGDGQRYEWETDASAQVWRRRKAEGGFFIKDVPAWLIKKYDFKNYPRDHYFLALGDSCFAAHFALWYGLPEEVARLVSNRRYEKRTYAKKTYIPSLTLRILNAAVCGWSLEDIQRELQRWEADRTTEAFLDVVWQGKYHIYRGDEDLIARSSGEKLICEDTGEVFTIFLPDEPLREPEDTKWG